MRHYITFLTVLITRQNGFRASEEQNVSAEKKTIHNP